MTQTATAKAPTQGWFTVSKEGLASLRENAPPASVLYELLQNAFDEDTKVIEVALIVNGPGRALLSAVDDSPQGFRDLSDAYTLFAPSYKKAHAAKRGRFNVGEKMVLAIADYAKITTTTGTVTFNADGTRDRNTEPSMTVGTRFEAQVRMTRKQVAAALQDVLQVIPPTGRLVYVNGKRLAERTPLRVFPVKHLPTVLQVDGSWNTTERNCEVEVYEPLTGEKATIYEMGIPIVETGDRWHVNVLQKVPLNMDRDNVTPAYLRRIREKVLEAMLEQVKGDEAAQTWVREGLAATDDPKVVQHVIRERFGEKVVAYDPSDVEGSKKAVSEGYTVVYPRSLGSAEWASVKQASALLGSPVIPPAGQVTPSNASIELSADGKPDYAPDEAMLAVAQYAKHVGTVLLGFTPIVRFTCEPTGGYLAAYARASRNLIFNVGALGKKWFSAPDQDRVMSLLLHEYAHAIESDHLSERYHQAVCDLGAKAVSAAGRGWLNPMKGWA